MYAYFERFVVRALFILLVSGCGGSSGGQTSPGAP